MPRPRDHEAPEPPNRSIHGKEEFKELNKIYQRYQRDKNRARYKSYQKEYRESKKQSFQLYALLDQMNKTCYVGRTQQSIEIRYQNHKAQFNYDEKNDNLKNFYKYVSDNNLTISDFRIELLGEFSTIEDLRIAENAIHKVLRTLNPNSVPGLI